MKNLPNLALPEAIRCLKSGGVLLFPTETFYALGCLASVHNAVNSIYTLKDRDKQKPLPLIATNLRQVKQYFILSETDKKLTSLWPGALTLLLAPQPNHKKETPFADLVVNGQGKVAVRVSPHPLVRLLSLKSGGLLTASSANLSGQPAVAQATNLDKILLDRLLTLQLPTGLLLPRHSAEEPAGILPSTIVETLPDGQIRLIREGSINIQILRKKLRQD